MLKYITSNSEDAIFLRSLFTFYVIPMVNPDGVVLGNSRCSFAGIDLNRAWKDPRMDREPEVFRIK